MSNIDQFSGIEVLIAAIEIENTGYKFYSELSQLFKQTAAVEIFTTLAADENLHIQSLMKLANSYKNGSFWENEQEYIPYLKRFNETQVFPSKDKIEDALNNTSPELKILDLAIQAELRFSEYFTIAAQHSRTKDGKVAFGWLANEEKNMLNCYLKGKS